MKARSSMRVFQRRRTLFKACGSTSLKVRSLATAALISFGGLSGCGSVHQSVAHPSGSQNDAQTEQLLRGFDYCKRVTQIYAESQRGACGNRCEFGPDSDHHAIAVREFSRCMACANPGNNEMKGTVFANFAEFALWFREQFVSRSPDWQTDNAANTGGKNQAYNGFYRTGRPVYMQWESQRNYGTCNGKAPFPIRPG